MKRLPVTDGMRAIAVIAVVIFHTFSAIMPGGFIGVDVFFVISGFVITLVYAERLVDKKIRFREFFTRRVRRLAPAYIIAVLATTAVAFAIMLPRDLSNFASSLVLQGFYAQNIAFWMIGDYFEAALAKPLLHTWSLAVEEQFYFLFPLLILLARARRSWAFSALIFASLVSLALGLYINGISAKTSFYWLPTRVWEFGAGMLAAWLFQRNAIPKVLVAPVANAGLVAIVISFFAFGGASAFPGWQSLLAVGGSTMLLVSQDIRTPGTDLLRQGWAQQAGKISYSWYLWHWPPLSLWFLATGAPATGLTAIALAGCGLLAGILSYRFIEQPVARDPRRLKPTHALAVVGAFAIFAVGTSAVVFKTDGFVRHYPPEVEKLMRAQLDVPPYRCPLTRRLALWREESCRLNDVKGPGGVLLIGDSHADRTKTALLDLADAAGVPLYLTKRNCRLSDYGARPDCGYAALVASIRHLGIKQVVAIAHWDLQLTDADRNRFAANIANLGVPVYLQLPTPSGVFFDPAVRLNGGNHASSATRASTEQQTTTIRTFMLAQAASHQDITILDPLPILCPTRCKTETQGQYLYRDENHLTLPGVNLLKPLYAPIFSEQ